MEAGFHPDVVVEDGQKITGPGWSFEAILTPGHASNHVCYALEEEHAIFSGDHIMGWSTTIVSPPDGNMGDYYASLDKIDARGFTTLWPTHGPPVTEVAPFISAYRAHRKAREAQIINALKDGPKTVMDMVPVLYAAVDSRLHPAAARSMLASIFHLVETGVVATDGAPGPASVYRLA